MDNQIAINEFINKVKWLHEVDYGDFKRKLSNYIMRLEQEVQAKDAKANDLFRILRNRVLYSPSGDIEEAREQTVELAEKLKLVS